MTVSLVQWCAVMGIFNSWISGTSTKYRYNQIRGFVSMLEILLLFYHYLEGVYIIFITILYIFVLFLCHEDTEPNPGPNQQQKSPSVCYWNLNSLSVHNFLKLTQRKHIFSFVNAISYASQKNIWILQHQTV